MSYVTMAHVVAVLRTSSLIFFFLQIKFTYSQLTYTNCSITKDIYTPNSVFHQNLKTVLSNLTFASSTTNFSFKNFSFGQENNTVYGIYLCRGDVNQQGCFSCIRNATQSITKECPNQKESIRWVPECMLRYANRNIFSKQEDSPSYTWRISAPISPPTNTTARAPTKTIFNMVEAVYNQINDTAFGVPNGTRFFSAKVHKVPGRYPLTIYSLAQCTPDISQLMCQRCLTHAYTGMRGSSQALAYFPNCHLRYDLRNFFQSKDAKVTSTPTSRTPSNGLSDNRKQRGSTHIGITIAIPTAVAILLFIGLCICIGRKQDKTASINDVKAMESLQYKFSTITAAVNNFDESNLLGRGGFGEVYKGRLQNGEEIAVKKLTGKHKRGFEEFKTEVLVVAKLQHKNLVRLLGYCTTQEEKLLIFEFLPNASLDKFLFDPEKSASLVWETRYKIIDGIAKGLLYLHEESRYKIIHRDLKPGNILLDSDMNPKIADFGLAKTFEENEVQRFSQRVAGTRGYIDPEYMKSHNMSVKSDVYSFGVLALEIVSGKKVWGGKQYIPEGHESLLTYAWRLWNSNESEALVDPALCGNFAVEEASRCIHIALSCTQVDPDKRPTMASIVSVLSSYSTTLPELPPDGFLEQHNMITFHEKQFANKYSGIEENTILTAR